MPAWICKPWAELTADDAYRILGARQRVFIVEQNCPYLDADDYDQRAWHLWTDVDGALAAYLRILPARSKYAEPSLGRILTVPEHRRVGLGRPLIREGIRLLEARCGRVAIRIGAQKYLERFYGDLGWTRDGAEYDEDGIPHIQMLRPPS